jgi:hypothetical protein
MKSSADSASLRQRETGRRDDARASSCSATTPSSSTPTRTASSTTSQAVFSTAPDPVRWLVIDCSSVTDIDYSAAISLKGLIDYVHAHNAHFGIMGADPGSLLKTMENLGLTEGLHPGPDLPQLRRGGRGLPAGREVVTSPCMVGCLGAVGSSAEHREARCQRSCSSVPNGATRARAKRPTSLGSASTMSCATRAGTTPATPSSSGMRSTPCTCCPPGSSRRRVCPSSPTASSSIPSCCSVRCRDCRTAASTPTAW